MYDNIRYFNVELKIIGTFPTFCLSIAWYASKYHASFLFCWRCLQPTLFSMFKLKFLDSTTYEILSMVTQSLFPSYNYVTLSYTKRHRLARKLCFHCCPTCNYTWKVLIMTTGGIANEVLMKRFTILHRHEADWHTRVTLEARTNMTDFFVFLYKEVWNFEEHFTESCCGWLSLKFQVRWFR